MHAFTFDVEDADDAAFAAWFAPIASSYAQRWPELPPRRVEENQRAARSTDDATRVLVGMRDDDGTVVGSALVRMALVENLDVLEVVEFAVATDRRREGIGQRLLGEVDALARAHGRTSQIGYSESRLDPNEVAPGAFARANGFKEGIVSSKRELRLPVDTALLDALEADASAHAHEDIELVTWVGGCPQHLVEGRLTLAHGMWTDTPSGELEREPERWDEARLRRHESLFAEVGRTLFAAGVVHRPTGSLVGFTEAGVSAEVPDTGFQYDTIVLGAYRGHRLGARLKVANLRAIESASPSTTRLFTWNADDNAPMIVVNDALGFRRVASGCVWQRHLG